MTKQIVFEWKAAKEPKKFVIRKIKRKSGGTYDREVLSEKWKIWRGNEAKRLRIRAKYFEERKELIKISRKNWHKASKFDSKTERMIYYKDIMNFVQFIDMRMAERYIILK